MPDRSFYELNSVYVTFSRKLTEKMEASASNYYQFLDVLAVREEETGSEVFA